MEKGTVGKKGQKARRLTCRVYDQENQSLQQDLKHEESLTEKSIEPLKTHLADLEAAIQEQLDK